MSSPIINCNCITFVNRANKVYPITYVDCDGNFIRREILGLQTITVCGAEPFSVKEVDIKILLEESISKTSYSQQVELSDLTILDVNETLFWNAIDNLIKNGLKYNDSENKLVKIYLESDSIIVEDNGRGLTEKQFDKIVKAKKDIEDVEEAGLGLNICLAIIKEHGFELNCEKIDGGTKMRIKVK